MHAVMATKSNILNHFTSSIRNVIVCQLNRLYRRLLWSYNRFKCFAKIVLLGWRPKVKLMVHNGKQWLIRVSDQCLLILEYQFSWGTLYSSTLCGSSCTRGTKHGNTAGILKKDLWFKSHIRCLQPLDIYIRRPCIKTSVSLIRDPCFRSTQLTCCCAWELPSSKQIIHAVRFHNICHLSRVGGEKW